MFILDKLLNKNRETGLMDRFLTDLIGWIMRMSLHHAKRRVGVKCRAVATNRRKWDEVCSKCVEHGSIAFEKCEQREATRHTGSGCSTEELQNIEGFVLLKSVVIHNIPLHKFLTRARRI